MRARSFLVEEVIPARSPSEQTLVRLSCLDDDAQGDELAVLWEREVDAAVATGSGWTTVGRNGFDPTKLFSAYLHTLRWNGVTRSVMEVSRRALGFDEEAFREALSSSLELSRAEPLAPTTVKGHPACTFPALDQRAGADPTWAASLDTIRGSRKKDEKPWPPAGSSPTPARAPSAPTPRRPRSGRSPSSRSRSSPAAARPFPSPAAPASSPPPPATSKTFSRPSARGETRPSAE